VERSDGRLAPVSYLFGAPAPSEPTEAEPTEAEPTAAEATATESTAAESAAARDAAGPVGDTAGPAANGRTPASGWYIEPGDDDAPSSRDDDELAVDDAPTEAPAIAAARRFLSVVENSVAAPAVEAPAATERRAGGVRFVEQADDAAESAPKPPAVRKASINALARKGMSSAEMVTLLENREIEPDEAAAEVQRLEAAGLLDDRVLAEDLVRSLRDRKGLGKSAITAELRRRRVDQAAIDEALDSVDVDDELERATEVAIKRAGQLSSYDRTTAERRLSAFLQRRGYSGSVVGAAVNAALGPAGPRFR
jgi:regulatory protein